MANQEFQTSRTVRNKNNGFGTPLSEINQAKYQIVTVKNTAIATESQSISGFTNASCARFRHAKMTTNAVVIPKNNTGSLRGLLPQNFAVSALTANTINAQDAG